MATICVVEDEEAIRELLVEELEDYGHSVITASDGLAGYDILVSKNYDLVISDINMPNSNGFEMRSRLQRDRPDLAKKPFMFLSAFADKADIADGMVVGVDAYLTKPIDFKLLIRWVDKLT